MARFRSLARLVAALSLLLSALGGLPVAAAPAATVALALTATGPGMVVATPAPDGATGRYAPGTVVTLEARPQPTPPRTGQPGPVVLGGTFLGWTVDGVPQGWANPLTITLESDHAVAATFAPTPTFCDVSPIIPSDPNAYLYSGATDIADLAARGILRGYVGGCFGPSDTVERAQLAAVLVRALDPGPGATAPDAPFADLGVLDPELRAAVGTLAAQGILRGYGDGTFGPTAPVLRVQVVAAIARAMVRAGYWEPVREDDPTRIVNVPADTGHRLEVLTFAKYSGVGVSTLPGAPWPEWDRPGERVWVAIVLRAALASYFAVDRVP